MAIVYMTQEGYDKKMAELDHLENFERPEVINAIREARDKGDLSENAEYDAAKERQGLLEAKIAELKSLIAGARIIDESKIGTDEVQLLNRVTIKNVANGMKMTYTIVTETEANLREGKISITTPIAKGLLGHKVGEVVDVQAPAGKMQFEILDIAI
ncbi:MAG: transcription elongation factor GreA [Muribaculaceae bacterium]|nr:transcription elongation factor GreA [Muribaculaceae bacterium]